MAKQLFSKASLAFYFLLIILIIVAFFHFTELQKILALVSDIEIEWFALAVIAQLLTYLFMAYGYFDLLILYGNQASIGIQELFKRSIINIFLNQAIPTGGVSGNSFLLSYFHKKELPLQKGFSVIVLNAITYYFSHLVLLFLSFFVLFMLNPRSLNARLLVGGVFSAVLFTLLLVLSFVFGSKKIMSFVGTKIRAYKWLLYLFNRYKTNFLGSDGMVVQEEWSSPFEVLKSKTKFLLKPIIWQLAIILADAFTLYFIFLGFNFFPFFIEIIIVLLLTKAVAAVAISPGALVVFEGGMVLFFNAFGIPLSVAIIVTLLFRALSFWLPMPFGLWLYRQISKQTANY